MLWEASDRICGKRLRSLIPILVEAMERHGHLQLVPEVRDGTASISAATIDRALREAEGPGGRLDAILRHQQPFAAACQCGPSPIGRIRRRASLKPIW